MSATRNAKTTLLPLIGWCAVLPLALLALLCTPLEAGLAAALVGGLASAATVWSRTLRQLLPLTAAAGAVNWGVSVALAALLAPGPWLVVVHTARLGGDLMTTAVLATASTSAALALCGHLGAAAAGGGFVVAMLAFG